MKHKISKQRKKNKKRKHNPVWTQEMIDDIKLKGKKRFEEMMTQEALDRNMAG